MVGGQLLGVSHGMKLAAHVNNRIDVALVAEHAGEVPVLPPHQNGAVTGLLDLAAPSASLLTGDGLDAPHGDMLRVVRAGSTLP
jgi:hypothetical protein